MTVSHMEDLSFSCYIPVYNEKETEYLIIGISLRNPHLLIFHPEPDPPDGVTDPGIREESVPSYQKTRILSRYALESAGLFHCEKRTGEMRK